MKTIHKYPIPVAASFPLRLPEGAEILILQMQRNVPCIWALVDPSKPLRLRVFVTVGTGFGLDDKFNFQSYVGTYQDDGFVWHVFEEN